MRRTMTALYPADWDQRTWEQKREWRFNRWRATGDNIQFQSAEAEERYKAKIERLIAVYNVRQPDRVPVSAMTGQLPLVLAGIDYHTAIYQVDKAVEANLAFNRQHADEVEGITPSTFFAFCAQAFDILDNRLYAYPGHGMPLDGMCFQYVEGEYMMPDEYDDLIADPSDFWLRTYLPRVFGVLEPLAQVETLPTITGFLTMQLPCLARPDVQAMLQRLLDAGKELARYQEVVGREMAENLTSGYGTAFMGGFATAPFDVLGDTLRGTRGIMTDIHRQPEKLLQALDVVADVTINSLLNSPTVSRTFVVGMPLHKGADGWMSRQQFCTFYWPSLKKVVDALVDQGFLVSLFAEGCYNTRLELVNEFPKGAVHWKLDRTDMTKAKRILGGNCSIEGNVPSSLLVMGTAEQVKEESRRLIEVCGPGGGYILGPGAIPEHPRLENIKAMVDAAREYGTY